MSTKATIAYGEDFHFYREVFDDENVYLRLDNAEFEACKHEVTVKIPLSIWYMVCNKQPVDLQLVTLSAEELLAKVETEVDQRLKKFAEHKLTCEECQRGTKCIYQILGVMSYGIVTAPREEQIKKSLYTLKLEQERQQRIATQIGEYLKK